MKTIINTKLIVSCLIFTYGFVLNAQDLFVGTNYHSQDDKNIEKEIIKIKDYLIFWSFKRVDTNYFKYEEK